MRAHRMVVNACAQAMRVYIRLSMTCGMGTVCICLGMQFVYVEEYSLYMPACETYGTCACSLRCLRMHAYACVHAMHVSCVCIRVCANEYACHNIGYVCMRACVSLTSLLYAPVSLRGVDLEGVLEYVSIGSRGRGDMNCGHDTHEHAYYGTKRENARSVRARDIAETRHETCERVHVRACA